MSRKSPARKDTLLRRFHESVDHDELCGMLSYSPDPRAQRLLELLFDPAYRNHSFGKLCERAHLKITDLLDLFRKFSIDLAILKMSRHLPQIA